MALPPVRRRGPIGTLVFVVLIVVAIPVVAYAVFLVAAIVIAPDWK